MDARGTDRDERSPLLPKSTSVTVSSEIVGSLDEYVDPTVYQRLTRWLEDAGFPLRLAYKPKGIRWQQWGGEHIEGDSMVLPLLVITFSCALADAITLQRYTTFATSMTGNTVLLAVRMMGTTDKSPLPAGVSLAGFVISGLVFGQLGGKIGHRRRDWLLFNFASQVAILVANVALVAPGVSRVFRPEGQFGWLYLLLLAIQGGIQVTQAANSGAREIPSAMMTTPYAALISDPTLFTTAPNVDVKPRNRRIVYIIVFWLGAFAGAALSYRANIFIATVAVLLCKVAVLAYLAFIRGTSTTLQAGSEATVTVYSSQDVPQTHSTIHGATTHDYNGLGVA